MESSGEAGRPRLRGQGTEDRGRGPGYPAILLLHVHAYTRLLPTYNTTILTTPTVPTVTLLYPPCFSTSLRHRRDLRRGRFPFRERRRTHPRRYILPLQKTRQVNKTEDGGEEVEEKEKRWMSRVWQCTACVCVRVCVRVCECASVRGNALCVRV